MQAFLRIMICFFLGHAASVRFNKHQARLSDSKTPYGRRPRSQGLPGQKSRSRGELSASSRSLVPTRKKSSSSNVSQPIRSRGFTLDTRDTSIAREVVGQSFDLKNSDFWTWRHLRPLRVFSNDMPDSCFEEMAVCPHSKDVGVKEFQDFSSLEKHSASRFGINLGIKTSKGGAGFHLNFYREGKNQANSSKHYYKMWAKQSQKCFEISPSCIRNARYLDESVKQRLLDMKAGSDDLSTMEKWSKYFVRLYGSHVAVQSVHGASVEVVISRSGDCHFDMSKRGHDWGVNANVDTSPVGANMGLHGSGNRTQQQSGCKDTTDIKCSGLGGKQQVWPCPKATDDGFTPVSEQEIDNFLTGDTTTNWAQKTFSYKLKQLSEVLVDMDFSWVDHAETLQKAVEYHACDPPNKWMLSKEACSKEEYKSTPRLLRDQGESLSEHPGTDLARCTKLCDDHPRCKSFSWGEKGRKKRRKAYCTLLANLITGYEPLVDPPRRRSSFKNYYKTCAAKESLAGYNYRCACTLKCLNGGELDEHECKCKCPGGIFQGWPGRDCSVPYGRCQPGPWTRKPARAAQCAIDGMCVGGPGKKKACGPTEVCCIPGGLAGQRPNCCPFGSSCNCGHYGCKCIAGATRSLGLSSNESAHLFDADYASRD